MAAVLNRRRIFAIVLAAFGLGVAVGSNALVEVHVRPPVPIDNLGLAVDHAEQAAPIAAQMPRFFVVGAEGEDNSKKNVRLWESAKLATGGKHIRNYPQETGDCVSFGTRNAAEYYLASAIGRGVLDSEYHEIFPPYTYGGSRVIIGKGKLGRSAGSVGAWAAEFTEQYGVLRADGEDVPKYSGKVAEEWGFKGPPKEFVDAGKMFTFETVSPVTSAAEARDALCNFYPVTVASDFGTKTLKIKDGRRVAVRNARWFHQMCAIAYDGSAPGGPYFFLINNWGENAHSEPMQGEPPGGFWITWADMEYIVRQGDSYAYSGFAGFPQQEFKPDFSVIGAAGPPQPQENVAMQPTAFALSIPQDWQAPGTALGIAMLLAAVVLWLWRTKHHGGNGIGRVAGIVAAVVLGVHVDAARAQEIDFSRLTAAAQSGDHQPIASRLVRGGTKAQSDPECLDFSVLATAAIAVGDDEPAIDFTALSVAANPVEVLPPAPSPLVDAPAPTATAKASPVYPTRGALWSHPGVRTKAELINHLMSGQHAGKFTRSFLESQSMASLEALHSDDHEGKALAVLGAIKQPAKPKRYVMQQRCGVDQFGRRVCWTERVEVPEN